MSRTAAIRHALLIGNHPPAPLANLEKSRNNVTNNVEKNVSNDVSYNLIYDVKNDVVIDINPFGLSR